jgi:hypothetical protein
MNETLKSFTDADAAALPKGFLITLTASSGGGKSVLLQHILGMPSMRSRFAAAIVVSPTSCLSCLTPKDEPNQFACIPRAFHYDLSKHSLTDILGKIKSTQMRLRRKGQAGEILLVLDDIFCSVRGAGQNCTAFQEWVSVKRHYLCSVAAIQQSPKNLAPSIRTQISGAFFSRPLTFEDRKRVCEWYLCRKSRGTKKATMEHAGAILDECYSHSPYAFLFVNAMSKEQEPRKMVRVALAPSGDVKPFKMKFTQAKRLKNPGGIEAVPSPADQISLSIREDPVHEADDEPTFLDLG